MTDQLTKIVQTRNPEFRPGVGPQRPPLSPALTATVAAIASPTPRPDAPETPKATAVDFGALLVGCGVPVRHVETSARSDEPAWCGWLSTARSLMGTGAIVVLFGSRGSGKTQIARELILDRLILRRKLSRQEREKVLSPRYIHVMQFFLAIRSAYSDESVSESEQIRAFTTPSLLVIDEIHERGETDWENRMLRHVIDARYGAKLDTVLIGNKDEKTLSESMGKSIASRIEECGQFIECMGVNWRAKP